jgi:hypothetical protein
MLVRILQHVPLKQRLTRCVRVCTAWASAATAATTRVVQHPSQKCRKMQSLQSWLRLHGEHLQVLQLRGTYTYPSRPVYVQFPWTSFANLQELLLDSWPLSMPCDPPCITSHAAQLPSAQVLPQAAAAASTSSSTPQLSTLTLADPGPLLPSLRKLQLSNCNLWSVDSPDKPGGQGPVAYMGT